MTIDTLSAKKGSRRSAEKMTVVDSLAAAYEKQDLAPEEWEFALSVFADDFNLQSLTRENIERLFAILRDITDRVALMNSMYPSDLEKAFTQLDEFIDSCEKLSVEDIQPSVRLVFMSHLTFHREIVSEIISEARNLLMDDRRPFLQRLVTNQRHFTQWLSKLEKRFI